jgi:outer membrane protein assembly factor BamB
MNHPLILDGTVYLGSAGGWVHAVELKSGEIKWSFLAAPALRRMIACGQVESAWPVITVQMINGHIVCVAGRRDSFDGGIFVTGLDPLTGEKRWEQNISVPENRDNSVAEAKKDGYTGFGRKKSIHAGPLYKGDNENTWWMVGTTPVKIPPTP